jgi:hypothetical protein
LTANDSRLAVSGVTTAQLTANDSQLAVSGSQRHN